MEREIALVLLAVTLRSENFRSIYPVVFLWTCQGHLLSSGPRLHFETDTHVANLSTCHQRVTADHGDFYFPGIDLRENRGQIT